VGDAGKPRIERPGVEGVGRDVNIIILTPVRVLGDGLARCFDQYANMSVVAVISELATLRNCLIETTVDLVLIDVTQGVDLYDIRSIAVERPDIALVALGLPEQRQAVIRCGRAGFTGYIARDATIDVLYKSISEIIQGRLACPAEISSGLLRALFRNESLPDEPGPEISLTRREGEVLQLIGGGLSNKEIARELSLSIATVKHHVHNVLGKLQLPRRAQAMRRLRDAPWIVPGERVGRRRTTS
jgi:two-component system nitrate/nitrite response regulator NarL